MTLVKLYKRFECFYLDLLNIYESLKKYKSSKKYNITYLSLNRFFNLKIAKTAPELEKQADRFFTGKARAFLYEKELKNRLQTSEKMVLNLTEGLVW
jgi:hypothetical protein